jgi:hypothetical protein
LFAFGDESDLVDIAYVTDTDFVWKNMDNYVRHTEIFTGISGPQNSNKGVTNTVDIFEQIFYKICCIQNCE